MDRIRPVVLVVLFGLVLLLVLLPLASAPPSGAYAADLPTGDRRRTVDASQPPDVSALMAKAAEKGHVLVIVGLRLPKVFTPEGALASRTAIDKQRDNIASSRQALLDSLAGTNAETYASWDSVPYVALKVDAKALQQLAASPHVTTIQEDVPVPPALASTTAHIGADLTWAAGFGGLGQTVVILDTGIDEDHPFFGGRLVTEACWSNAAGAGTGVSLCPGGGTTQTGLGSADAMTAQCISGATNLCEHGSHVAGIAAGRDPGGVGYNGVAPEASIIAIQVFTRFNAAGDCAPSAPPCVKSYSSDQLNGLNYINNTLRLNWDIASANLSLGGGMNTTACDADPLKAAIDNLRANGIATVIASGNDGWTDALNAPGCISTAVTVGAVEDPTDAVIFNMHQLVDLLAVGARVDSSIPNDAYGLGWWGTSMATPQVTGAFAMIKAIDPCMSVTDIEDLLEATGVLVTDTRPPNPAGADAGHVKPRIQLLDAVLQVTELSINSTADTGDGNPGDGICDTGTIASPTGICTLRAAIEEANANCVSDTIKFNIPVATDPWCDGGGVCTIRPGSALPVITNPVIIDGYTQPGASVASSNAVLKIVLDGSLAGNGVNGLVLETNDSTIRGLVIHGFRVTNLASYDFSEGNGIVVREGISNTITGNFIGTNVDGDACVGNGGSGVLIGGPDSIGAANNNTVGGTSAADRNIITCNGFQDQTATGWDGVAIWATNGANSNVVQGNYIGTDVTGAMTLTAGTDISGTVHIGNTGNGVRIAGGSSNIVSGTVGVAPSILSGNELAGVRIEASPVFTREANSNVVQGNYIGTDVTGTGDLGNLDVGVYIVGLADDADSNQIGGTTAAERNLISGNGASGVFILGGLADNNDVMGNYIGTDVNGTAAMPNDSGGIMIIDAENNTIGGTSDAARNLISGNTGIGVAVINGADDGDADGNVIQGNYIGTDVSGTTALSNTLTGVVITGAANNDVGGTAAGARNLVSGNGEYGVIIMESGATGNDVQGNYIGTDFDGDAAIPNQGAGVLITNASSNTVGGTTAEARNLISGNVLQGVRLIGADDNTVRSNLIGTQADGTSPLGNGSHGVVIADSDDNDIGIDGVFPQDNTIAYNGGDGVLVLSGTGNQILSNSIFDNDELGIDLGDDNDVTPNDEDDPDTGANNLQNYPVLTAASVNGNTTIEGVLNSTASTQFTIQFFANTACDPSGFGEGRTYLATDTPTTDGAGDTTTSATVAGDLTGQFITATATDPYSNTSEFSNCIPVPAAPVLTINKEVQDLNGGSAKPGDTLLYTINYSNTGNAPATGVTITDTYSISCTTISNVTTDLNFTTFFSDTTRIRWPATGGILLDAQAGGSVSYRCTLQTSFPAGITDVENTATIDSDQTTPQEDTETVQVTVAPVLTIDKECTPATGNSPGDTVHCVIQYANTGDAYATGATIVDDYDQSKGSVSGITGSAHFAAGTNNGDTIAWGPSTIPAGESGQVEYDYTLAGAGTFPHGTTPVTNTATIDSNDTGSVADPETVSVTAAAVLTIDKQGQDPNGGLAEPGDTLQYTINYANTGDALANGVFITDDYSDLCATISNVTTDANFPTFSDSAGVLRWPQHPNTTTLAAGASGSLTYDCTLQDPFPAGTTRVTNTGTIDSDETGPEQDTETLFTVCFDFNENGVVDIGDIMQVVIRWGLTAANPDPDGDPATPNYEAKYDANEDGVITVADIMMVAAQWGQTC